MGLFDYSIVTAYLIGMDTTRWSILPATLPAQCLLQVLKKSCSLQLEHRLTKSNAFRLFQQGQMSSQRRRKKCNYV